jgi:cobalt/nickel transport system permease protein
MGALCNHALELGGLAGRVDSDVHRLDPRAKILGLGAVTVVAVSTPLALWPVFCACAAVLVGIAAAARVRPGTVWRRSRFILPVVAVLVVFLPFVRTGGTAYALGPLTAHEAGLAVAAAVALKALVGTVGAVLLAATTSYPAVLRGLEALRVPRLLVLIGAFMYRYLFVIVDELGRMRAAMAARGFRPRTVLHAGATGRLAGALFLRTYGRGERVYLAMLARGYAGHMPQLTPLALRRADALFVAAVVLALVPLRIAGAISA